jgi:Fe-S oxidoreductase/FAD/FMN-containing dehydrogenase
MQIDRIERDLRKLGIAAFTTSAFERDFYRRDAFVLPRWLDMCFQTMPLAVVRPRSSAEVAAVVRYCFERAIPVVPRGAGTSGLFGAVPKRGGIVIDMCALAGSTDIDKERGIVHVDAGVTCWELEGRLGKEGLALRSYPSSALSATLGGWIMGSGLGIGSLEYGPVFGSLLSAEAVLADGSRVAFATEEDLEWLCGSEGMLAILTRVSLKVRRSPQAAGRHLVYFDDVQRLFAFVRGVVTENPVPYAVEVFDSSYLSLLKSAGYHVTDFTGGDGAVLVVFEGDGHTIDLAHDSVTRLARAFGGQVREGGEREWDQRFNTLRVKRAAPSILPIGVYVPLEKLEQFHEEARRETKRPLGLLGQVISPVDCMVMAMVGTDERHGLEHTLALRLSRTILDLALSLGGKPGGGVGVWNAPYKRAIASTERLEGLKEKKRCLDPKGILNPGMWLDESILLKPGFYRMAMAVLTCVDRLVPAFQGKTERGGLEKELAACVDCGYCVDHCPTRGEWISTTPRGRVRLAKEIAGAGPGKSAGSLEGYGTSIFKCTLCGRCSVDCSVAIDAPAIWVETRERLARQGLEPDCLKDLSKLVKETGNIAGKPNAQRLQWAARLPSYARIAGKRRAEVVYFVGCVTSFYPTVQNIARSFVRTLDAADVPFMVLGGDEQCCGYPQVSAGHADQAESQMRGNVEKLREAGVRTLLATCPGCYRMWKHEYRRLTGESPGVEVLHSTQFLWQLIEQGRLRPGASKGKVAYHDPCDLGRVSGIYEAPRSIIKAVGGVDYVELEESRQYSACCGSGGDLLASDQDLSLKLARQRLDQVQTAGADTVVTACPSCVRGMIMARTAAKRQVNIMDVTEFLWRSIEREE